MRCGPPGLPRWRLALLAALGSLPACGEIAELKGLVSETRKQTDAILARCNAQPEADAVLAEDLTEDQLGKAVAMLGRLGKAYEHGPPDKASPAEFTRWYGELLHAVAAAYQSEGMSCTRGAALVARVLAGVRRLQAERAAPKLDVAEVEGAFAKLMGGPQTTPARAAASLDAEDLDRIEARYAELTPVIEALDAAVEAERVQRRQRRQ